VAALLVVAGGIHAAAWYRTGNALLLQEPPRRAARLELPAQESEAALRLRVPFGLLREAADRALPREFSQEGEGDGTRYNLTVRRAGDFVLSEVDGRLRASVPLTVDGSVGLSGGLAGLLSLAVKKFEAAADVRADLGLTMDAAWCPSATVAVDYRWTRSPRLEIIGGVWIGIESRVREQVEAALRELPGQLRELLPCGRVQETVRQLWRTHSIPIQLPAAPPLHVQVQPLAAGVSELAVRPDHLRLALALRARTAVSSRPAPRAAPGPLPPLRDFQGRGGRLRLSIPIRAGYDMIRDWLVREFGGRDIPFEIAGRQVLARVREITVYPSAPSIAVAITFDARMPGFLPDTSGRVVLAARPVMEGGGTRIRLADLRFARELDSLLWSAVSLAFQEQIREQLSAVAVYDLDGIMKGALAELRRRLSDPAMTGGVRISLGNPVLRLERVVAENDALAVLGTAEAFVEGEITALPGG